MIPEHVIRDVAVCGLAAAATLLAGCREEPDAQAAYMQLYRTALARTAPAAMPLLGNGMPGEAAAMEQFRQFYLVYSAASITSGVRTLYAPDAYFGDPFKAVQGIDAIETYFLKMAEPVESCTFTIDGFDGTGGEYYCTWEMQLVSRAARDKPIRALGISHVRFNPAGQVVFQQDYWDSSTLFDKLPVVGSLTRFVKARLE